MLLPSEITSIEMAVRDVESRHKQPVIPHVVEALLSPSYASATTLRTTVAELSEDGRQVALELRRLVTGDMFGMFDAPTTSSISLDAPLVVLDLSAIYGSDALGILMTCAMAWLQGIIDRLGMAAPGNSQIILVVDEAWAVLKNPAAARWLQSSWKLARAKGVSNIAVVHRASDLMAVGSAGAEQIELAKGLLSDSETRVIYTQPPGEVALARELMGLTPVEEEIIRKLARGTALWKVGQRSFLVRHAVSAVEQQFVQTDQRMGVRG
jgi:type IV secretory pathway VirB4 component